MNSEIPNLFHAFEARTVDNDEERATLARELHAAKAFTLLFAICNDASERERQIASLRQENSDLYLLEMRLQSEFYHLRDGLREIPADPFPDVVCIYGMENWIRSDVDPRTVPFLLNLNAGRNHFALDCPRPLLFWVPEYLFGHIANSAPDFFSIRSGVYVFATKMNHKNVVVSTLEPETPAVKVPSQSLVDSLTAEEKQERLRELTEILQIIQALPQEERDETDEARTLLSLARLYISMDENSEAEAFYRKALGIYERSMGQEQPKAHDAQLWQTLIQAELHLNET